MATPTQKLTSRAASHIGEEVTVAVRVRRCEPSAGYSADPGSDQQSSGPGVPPQPFPAAGFPVVAIARGIRRFIGDALSRDHDDVCHVLAFTADGERVLMGRQRLRSLRPSGTTQRLPNTQPISVDVDLLSERLIPQITVNHECFTVSSIDFGVLTRAAVEGELDEPGLAEQLRPYYEQAKAFMHYDPRTLRGMMPDKYDPRS